MKTTSNITDLSQILIIETSVSSENSENSENGENSKNSENGENSENSENKCKICCKNIILCNFKIPEFVYKLLYICCPVILLISFVGLIIYITYKANSSNTSFTLSTTH